MVYDVEAGGGTTKSCYRRHHHHRVEILGGKTAQLLVAASIYLLVAVEIYDRLEGPVVASRHPPLTVYLSFGIIIPRKLRYSNLQNYTDFIATIKRTHNQTWKY